MNFAEEYKKMDKTKLEKPPSDKWLFRIFALLSLITWVVILVLLRKYLCGH